MSPGSSKGFYLSPMRLTVGPDLAWSHQVSEHGSKGRQSLSLETTRVVAYFIAAHVDNKAGCMVKPLGISEHEYRT